MKKLAVLNTLLYPELSGAVLEFVKALSSPELRDQFTGPEGLEAAMRLGLADQANLTEEVLAGVREPFQTADARRALAEAGIGLDPEGFVEIAERLPSLTIPVRVVYGERDAILPDIADTVARLRRELPQTEVTALPRLRPLPPGGGARGDRRAAGSLLRRGLGDGRVLAWPRATSVSSSRAARRAVRAGDLRARRGGCAGASARARRWCAPSGSRSIPPTAPGSARRRPTCRRWPSARSCAPPGWVAWSSRSTPRYEEGQLVQGLIGWQEWMVASDSAPLLPVTEVEGVAPSLYLGALGMTGLTAWIGINDIGKPQEGETVVVSAAAGAVGLGGRSARQGARRPGGRNRRRAGEVRAAHRAARLRRRGGLQGRGLARPAARPPRPTGSTWTSRTWAARSWTRSSRA